MYRFNYRLNLLFTPSASYNLDHLREWLLINATSLCKGFKIKTIFRHKTIIKDTVKDDVMVREMDLHGGFVNTYDWDGIFFSSVKNGLIQNFINDYSKHRNCPTQAVAR